MTTIHYLVAKSLGRQQAGLHLHELLAISAVAVVDRDVFMKALDVDFTDFEDAVLHEAGSARGASAIVTRNGKVFASAHS